jgi:predicted nucleic acid-binding Zn ribbon protein
MPERFEPPGPCPVCGDDVPPNARACPGCGSCHNSGWSEAAAYDALDLPDPEFDYEAYVAEEFGSGDNGKRHRPARWVVVAAIVLLVIWVLIR